jgi:hypothetical protein
MSGGVTTPEQARALFDMWGLWRKITPQQQADVMAHLRGILPGAETYPCPAHGWTCFHCGETFTTFAGAVLHFGTMPTDKTVCQHREELKVKSPPPGGKCAFTRGIVLAAAEMARFDGTDSTHVRTLISAAGGVRAVLDHGDTEDIESLREVGAIRL